VKVYIQNRGKESEIGVAEEGMAGGRGDVQGDMQISRSIYTPVRLRWRVANGVSATLHARARASYRMY
jgi:hypothetical protein